MFPRILFAILISVVTASLVIVSNALSEAQSASRVVNPTPLGVGVDSAIDAELTEDDLGVDWYRFGATAGQSYIIELKPTIATTRRENDEACGHPCLVPGHLVEPSVLKIWDEDGAQLMGEQDQGGIVANASRVFFTPQHDGTHYIAVGAGELDRTATGFYTISIRTDDHADDYHTATDVILRSGDSIIANIDSDVAPDDPRLNPWDWVSSPRFGTNSPRPHPGVETLDDSDVFRVDFAETGWYRLEISDSPAGVGIWYLWRDNGTLHTYTAVGPVASIEDHFFTGTLYVEIGTPYESEGNTGLYTLSLMPVDPDP